MYALVAERPAEVAMRECDQDGIAAAQYAVLTGSGEVLLCAHHYHEHADAIVLAGHHVLTVAS